MSTDEAYHLLAKKSRNENSELVLNILKKAMTPEEAAFLVELPAENADLAAKFNMDEDAVKDKLDEFMRRGLAVPTRKGIRFPSALAYLHEIMLSSDPELIPPELPDLWKELYEKKWREECGEGLSQMEAPILRVMPAYKSVPEGTELMPWENMKAIVEASKSRSIRNCACRTMVRDCDSSAHNCMQFNKRADYAVSRGGGKEMTVEEIINNCLAAEDDGLIPMVGNISLMKSMDYICYCCSCCCTGLDPLKRIDNIPAGFAKSRFIASNDQETCSGCQVCVDRCHFDAIEMVKVEGSKKLKAEIDREKCFGCGLCVIKCESDSITMELVRPLDHIPRENATVMS
jgi:Na+-translocating ferredoxin:NAD+ oxidoreductase subunit B